MLSYLWSIFVGNLLWVKLIKLFHDHRRESDPSWCHKQTLLPCLRLRHCSNRMPGRTTGLMMDSGDDVLHEVPCFEDYALPLVWILLAVIVLESDEDSPRTQVSFMNTVLSNGVITCVGAEHCCCACFLFVCFFLSSSQASLVQKPLNPRHFFPERHVV